MALYTNQFNQITVAQGGSVYSSFGFPGGANVGPVWVNAYFEGGDNWGTITTVQVSTNSFEDNQYGYYWPTAFNYSTIMRNDSQAAVGPIALNIGTFQ